MSKNTASLTFTCNVCSAKNTKTTEAFGRETASCDKCRSTVRMRSIVHVLSTELFGECLPIDQFPDRELRGLGMSDWNEYAKRIQKRLDYTNTFYDGEPRLDITDPDPDLFGTLDFLVATDVFEHVAPPVEAAFANACKLLKPTGVFVFSVPYKLKGDTDEHFPDLFDYRIQDDGGEQVLINTTRSGEQQVFKDLVFHGGRGATLEMRVFSLAGLQQALTQSGFQRPRVFGATDLDCGMVWNVQWSLTMSVRPAG